MGRATSLLREGRALAQAEACEICDSGRAGSSSPSLSRGAKPGLTKALLMEATIKFSTATEWLKRLRSNRLI
jgi:hypothetical protein